MVGPCGCADSSRSEVRRGTSGTAFASKSLVTAERGRFVNDVRGRGAQMQVGCRRIHEHRGRRAGQVPVNVAVALSRR